ncbi:hypothetical protein D3C81_805560 [compost metagenome]
MLPPPPHRLADSIVLCNLSQFLILSADAHRVQKRVVAWMQSDLMPPCMNLLQETLNHRVVDGVIPIQTGFRPMLFGNEKKGAAKSGFFT